MPGCNSLLAGVPCNTDTQPYISWAALSQVTAAQSLGWFDVTVFGAIGDGITDDAPAIANAIKAAISSTSALTNRFATVYFPPLPPGGAYRLLTNAVNILILQGGNGASGCMELRLVGNGLDGPLLCDVGAGKKAFSVTSQLMEWMRITVENLTMLPGNGTYSTANGGSLVGAVNAKYGFEFGTGDHHGQTIIRNLRTVGLFVEDACLNLAGGNVYLEYQDDGSTVNNTGVNRGLVISNGCLTLSVPKAYSYGEFRIGDRIRGADNKILGGPVDYAAGGAQAFFYISGNTSSKTRIALNSVDQDGNRNTYFLIKDTDGIQVGSIDLANSNINMNTYGLYIDGCDSLWVRNTGFPTGIKRSILDLRNVTDAHCLSCSSSSLGVIVAQTTVGLLEICDTDLGPDTNAPYGVTSDAGATYISAAGVRARLRLSQAAIVSNTLVKAGATDGRVDQLATTDAAQLTTGICLDTASGAGKYVRVAEDLGQSVQVKSDGAGTLAPGDFLTSSGASAGRVKKAVSGNFGVVSNMSTVAASANALATGLALRTVAP